MIRELPRRILPIGLSPAMLKAAQRGFKDRTRRLAKSPLARVESCDLLWVREAIEIDDRPAPPGLIRFRYAADGPLDWRTLTWPKRLARPSGGLRRERFMPREFSRLTLSVRRRRFERLQDITESAARGEGIVQERERSQGACWWVPGITDLHPTARDAFADLWDVLHPLEGERWADNPEIVEIVFDTLGPVDRLVRGLGSGGVR